MRLLLLGPGPETSGEGSLPPYLAVLAEGLRQQGLAVDWHGSSGVPYDLDRGGFPTAADLVEHARSLFETVDLADYDLLVVHAGNLEVEQLLPALLAQQDRPPLVSHVHTLAPTLLRDHAPDPTWHRRVCHALRHDVDAFVYFGRYAQRTWHPRLPPGVHTPSTVAWLPTTIPDGTTPNAQPQLAAALDTARPVISLYGYAAPWKDPALLAAAAEQMRVPARIVLAGPYWDQPEHAGIDLADYRTPRRRGQAELAIVPTYLTPGDRTALSRRSTAGVFPYRQHRSFQGSGAIADYLATGTPVVATGLANMPELIGPAGRIVPTGNPTALAAALDALAGGEDTEPTTAAGRRAPLFTPAAHATRCATFYQSLMGTSRPHDTPEVGYQKSGSIR